MNKNEILNFWFGQKPFLYRSELWWDAVHPDLDYTGLNSKSEISQHTDNHIKQKYGQLLDELASEKLPIDSLLDVESKVAAMIVLDQFSRNIHRGTKDMFKQDAIAIKIAKDLHANHLYELEWPQVAFVAVVFMHQEEQSETELSSMVLNVLISNIQQFITKDDYEEKVQNKIIEKLKRLLSSAKHHAKIINKFGRYPHRNKVLERENTSDEVQYLLSKNLPKWTNIKGNVTQEENKLKEVINQPLDTKNVKNKNIEKIINSDKKTKKIKILVLHSNRQNSFNFKQKTKLFFSKLNQYQEFDFYFAQAPHEQKATGDTQSNIQTIGLSDSAQKNNCWWNATDDPGEMQQLGISDSLDYISRICTNEGPFHGILGFSQGGAMVGLVCSIIDAIKNGSKNKMEVLKEKEYNFDFKFAVMISGFQIRDKNQANLQLEEQPSEHTKELVKPLKSRISIPSFHIWGKADQLVDNWRSEILSSLFEDSKVHIHSSDHQIKAIKQWPHGEIRDFILGILSNEKLEVEKRTEFTDIYDKLNQLKLFNTDRKIDAMFEPIGIDSKQVENDDYSKIRSGCSMFQIGNIKQDDIFRQVSKQLSIKDKEDNSFEDIIVIAFCFYPYKIITPVKESKKLRLEREITTGIIFSQFIKSIIMILKDCEIDLQSQYSDQLISILLNRTSVKITIKMLILINEELNSNKEPSEDIQKYQEIIQKLEHNFIDKITNKLKTNLESLDESNDIDIEQASELPRIGHSNQYKTKLALKISKRQTELLNLSMDEFHLEKQYRVQIIRPLMDYLKEHSTNMHERNKKAKAEFRSLMYSMTYQQFINLRNAPISHLILEPEPRPVDVSQYEELKPLYDFIKNDQDGLEKEESQKKFNRGILFNDGRLDMCKNVIGPTGVDAFMGMLHDDTKNNMMIKHILLGNNIAGDALPTSLAELLQNSDATKLTTLQIAGNNISHVGISKLCKVLQNDKRIKQLWLKLNPLKPEGIWHIAELLKVNNTIEALDLANTAVFDKGLEQLTDALVLNNSIKFIQISGNAITLDGLKQFTSKLNQMKSLELLDLDCNRFYDEGVKIICDTLKENKTLYKLSLASSGISEIGADQIKSMLMVNNTLKLLDIGFSKMTEPCNICPNRLGNEGIKLICEGLENNKSIIALNVNHNHIYQDGIKAIDNLLDKNKNIVRLECEQMGIPLNELTKESIKYKIKTNYALLNQDQVSEQKYQLEPPHLKEILSQQRVNT